MEFFIGVALIILAASIGKSILRSGWHPGQTRTVRVAARAPKLSQAERIKALEVYRSLAKDKLDVIKTALAMGYKDDELKLLDERLERLIGRDALANIIEGKAPKPHPELLSLDVEREKQTLGTLRVTQRA